MKLFSRLTFLFVAVATVFWPLQDAQAQDPRFSQYYAAPLRVNPALTGVFDGTWRVGVNYRSQWGAVLGKSYKTFGATADLRLPVFRDDYVGLGFTAMTDHSGSGGYSTTDINLSANFQKKLSGSRRYGGASSESYLIAGVQLGMGQRGVKWDNLTFSTQWQAETGDYNQSILSGEDSGPLVRRTRAYVDASAGLMWYGSFGNRKNVFAGASVYHINRPDVSLFNRPAVDSAGNTSGNARERLYMRWTAHAGGEILLGGRNSSISLIPGVVAMFQGPSMEINPGIGIRYKAPKYDDFAFKISVWTRIANQFVDPTTATVKPDAMIAMIGMDFLNFQVGFSYDINISSLSGASNGRGAMEVSLLYTFDMDQHRGQGCPTF